MCATLLFMTICLLTLVKNIFMMTRIDKNPLLIFVIVVSVYFIISLLITYYEAIDNDCD